MVKRKSQIDLCPRVYNYNVKVVSDNVLKVELFALDGTLVTQSQRTISDPKVMQLAKQILHMPMEEVEFGVWGNDVSNKQLRHIMSNVHANAIAQV